MLEGIGGDDMKELLLTILYLFVLSATVTTAFVFLKYPDQFQKFVENMIAVGIWCAIGIVVMIFLLAIAELLHIFPNNWY